MPDLNEYDYKMLRILNGELPDEQWGAWWTACLEYLAGVGLCTRGPNYQLTEAGRAALKMESRNSSSSSTNTEV